MNRGKFLPKLVTPDAEHRMKRKLHPYFENLLWKKLVLTPCHIPSNFYRVKSECVYFFSTVQLSVFLHLRKKKKWSLAYKCISSFSTREWFWKEKSKETKVSSSTELSEAAAMLLLTVLPVVKTMPQLCLSGQQKSSFFRGYSVLCPLAESANSEIGRQVNVHQDSWDVTSIGVLFKNRTKSYLNLSHNLLHGHWKRKQKSGIGVEQGVLLQVPEISDSHISPQRSKALSSLAILWS